MPSVVSGETLGGCLAACTKLRLVYLHPEALLLAEVHCFFLSHSNSTVPAVPLMNHQPLDNVNVLENRFKIRNVAKKTKNRKNDSSEALESKIENIRT